VTRTLLRAAGALLLYASLVARPVEATRIFVPREHKSLQGAIDAATPGDTIWVASGTYGGPFVMKKDLTLFGDGGSEYTILDGGDSVRVLHIEGVKNSSVIGFRIQHGKAPAGGGIYCLADSGLSISSCDIRDNWESGISVWRSWAVSVLDCVVQNNTGSGLTANYSAIYVGRDSFIGNHGFAGGAISMVASSILGTIKETKFEGNRAEGATGGAINADSSTVQLTNCEFRGNSAAVAGGAIAVMDSGEVALLLTRFIENHAATGGAVLMDHSTLNVSWCIFDRNRCTATGAAIQALGRRIANVNPIITNNTFYRNGGAGDAAAIYCQQVSPDIQRNIFVTDSTNGAVLGFESSPRYDCNLVHPLSGSPVGPLPGTNTIVANPYFCDPDKGNFRLRELSPALVGPCGTIGAQSKGCSLFKMVPSK